MNHQPRQHTSHRAAGFTLIEVSLAIVLSAMVLAGCLSVFIALRNAESTFEARFQRTSELDITHTSFSRALLSLQMKEAETATVVRASSDEETTTDDEESTERPRIILQNDLTVNPDITGWTPQRFEVVCATPPVPAGLASQAANWYVAQSRDESLDYSALDGSQGITRGVFELRPTGQRERIMQRLGLVAANDPILADINSNEVITEYTKPDWTLWWRPILTDEAENLAQGFGPYPDSFGEPEAIRARLAGAVPLLRHIERCIWELYKGDEYITEHTGLEMSDLPAYAQFEVILTNSQYASWMFEIDWVLGDDPLEVAAGSGSSSDDTDTDDDTDGDDDTGTGNGGGGGGGGGGGNSGRPGSGSGNNTFDMSGNS